MNISLIGMMGSGKSTIGKLLAESLENYKFTDTDEEIINSEKMSINKIFLNKGEKYFRQIETEMLKNILKGDKLIIATGGGIINSKENIDLLKSRSKVIYLYTSVDKIYERIKNDKTRPLLANTDMKKKISDLMEERDSKYSTADFIIDTSNKNPDIIVKELTEKINKLWKK